MERGRVGRQERGGSKFKVGGTGLETNCWARRRWAMRLPHTAWHCWQQALQPVALWQMTVAPVAGGGQACFCARR